ncbi:MAG: folate-binding protein YgfZ [Methylococcaceae bacterium]|nr:folate-binding protein YgfZ [Methylococcaceae bacterium]
MNPAWKEYLSDLNAILTLDHRVIFNGQQISNQANWITPVSQLAVLRVSGEDANTFLQGQSTCNLNELNDQNSSFGAFCNVKGRVISTFLILKAQQDWLLLLPTELLPSIQKRLQLYILRAKVKLTDCSDTYCILGLNAVLPHELSLALPEKHLATLMQPSIIVRLGEHAPRYLLIAERDKAQQHWSGLIQQGFIPQSSTEWDLLDIQAGIPWLRANTSEEYIPQMLNLDQLGGISFNKGCYTGQEIVARTHYLGKAKRAMFTATANLNTAPPLNGAIIDTANGQGVGTVVATHLKGNCCTLQMVLATEAEDFNALILQDQPDVHLKRT